MPIIEHVIDNFPNGIIDTIENKDIPEGAASKSLNWITQGDRIELRRGQIAVGIESAATGKITGLWTAYRADGVVVVFRKNGRKCEYFINGVSSDWAECGTNMFPAAAALEDAAFASYSPPAGNQVWVSSPNSGLYKIMVANPQSFVDQSNARNFLGQFRMKITQNRMLAWGRIKDRTGLYGSWIDAQSYTAQNGQSLGTGDGATKTFSSTLVFAVAPFTYFAVSVAAATSALKAITAITQAANAKVTAASHGFASGDTVVFQGIAGMAALNNRIATVVSVIDANNFTISIDTTGFAAYVSGGSVGKAEVFTDDFSGNLSSPAGGTGTINYATGAVSLTFNTAPVSTAVIAHEYLSENSTFNGIADFTKSSPRTAGQGFIFRQDEGGRDLQNSFSFNGHEYVFHILRTWDLNITDTDTNASNLPYRAKLGISNWHAGVATSSGVYYINDVEQNNIKLERLELNRYMGVVPHILSKQVSKEGTVLGVILDGFAFDQAFMWEFGDLILTACRTSDSPTNNRVISFNKLTNAIDYLDFTVNCMAVVGSELWAGDSVSPNVYKILNGFDDSNANIQGSWEGKSSLLGSLYLKRCRRLVLQGLIGADQSYNVSIALGGSDYVPVGTISGKGSYVDKSAAVTIGYGSIGSADLGGSSNAVDAFNYEKALRLPIGKFVQARLKFEPTGIGYLSVSRIRWYDVQAKYLKILKQYT
jgi:hypothetical protein